MAYEDEIIEISRKIYQYAEIGSEEYRSSSLLVESLKLHGFRVQYPYMNMDTAFRAEWGEGVPVVGILAEYDALPNGHSCGHNLIAAWAYGTAINLKDEIKKGKIVVFGTPAEEGIGKYAGSKVKIAKMGAFSDVDFVIGMHPNDSWGVGAKALADITVLVVFKGKASHMADSPEQGINALDAAVTSYVGINNLRSWIKNDKHAVIGMIFREGGSATNVVPEKASLEIDLRSSSGEFLPVLLEKVKNLLKNVAEAYGADLNIVELTPLYESYKSNKTINKILEESLNHMGITAKNLDISPSIASGSTDEANVSKVVPTGHIDVKIGYPGIAGHSDDFRIAANPDNASEQLKKSIAAVVDAIKKIFESEMLLNEIKKEFAQP
ncbi:MAG: M20 family metallopeptidase [Thermoplasmata archaeon]